VTATVRAAFGLGSNIGDRHAFLASAIATLGSTPGITVVGVSPIVESAPVGGPPQQDYLNAVVVVDTILTPEALLALARRCETEAGRERRERWGPRTLDVDVLAYGELTTDDPDLTLPHPRAVERAFVLIPWAAVDPDFVIAGRSVSDWTAGVDTDGVRPADPVREG
jgi:2-amino-4-hydroxy-6-hydroxymethyldihydropteridine diphosphokinase